MHNSAENPMPSRASIGNNSYIESFSQSRSHSVQPSLLPHGLPIRSISPIRPARLQTQSTPNSMRPHPLDLSFIPSTAPLSLSRPTSPLSKTNAQDQNDRYFPIGHPSDLHLPSRTSHTAPLRLSNPTMKSALELDPNLPVSFPAHTSIPLEFNTDSPFSPSSTFAVPHDFHLPQNPPNDSYDRPSTNYHLPPPLQIIPSTFRRPISASFTTSGLISLEFPPNVRLHPITEDGMSIPSAEPTPSFQLVNSLQTPLPYAGSVLSPSGLPFATSPSIQSFEPSHPHQFNLHDSQSNARPTNPSQGHPDQYRKWASNFYVWVYDPPPILDDVPPPSPTSALNSSTPSNLSNQLMGGISKHFFNHSSKSSSLQPAKTAALKKDRRVKGLMSGLTKQKDSSSSDSPTVSAFENDQRSVDSHTLSLNERHLDSFADRSETDLIDLSKSNPNKISSNLKNPEVHVKPKRNSTPSEPNKFGRKRFVTGFGGSGSSGSGVSGSSGSITSQLALGPGPAMNSHGIGAGQWKLVQGVITEDGHFTLYTTDDAVLYQIHLPSYRRTDVRMVHQSIFGRLHCGVITRRTGKSVHSNDSQSVPTMYTSTTSLALQSSSSLPPPPATGPLSSQTTGNLAVPSAPTHTIPLSPQALDETSKNASISMVSNSSRHQATSSNGNSEVSIYVCMPNLVLLESWLVICKCFCRPDDFRHLYPRSNKKNQGTSCKGSKNKTPSFTNNQLHSLQVDQSSLSNLGVGDSGSLGGSIKHGLPERVRIWRGVEIQLLEGKKLGEYHQITVNNVSETNETKGMMKEERRNSTGGYLPGSGTASLLTIKKESLSNKSSNFANHQTAQQSTINDFSYQQQHQDHHRHKSKTNDELNGMTTGFYTSSTPSLNQQGSQVNRQSIQTPASKINLYQHDNSTAPLPANPIKSSTASSFVLPTLPNESSGHSSKNPVNASMNDNFYFVEFDWDREVMGRSTIKRNSNPFWREEFKFPDIGSFKTMMVLNVYQIKKNYNHNSKSLQQHSHSNQSNPNSSAYSSKIQLIGQTHLDFKKFEKNLRLQIWLPVYPHNYNNSHQADENCQAFGDENINSFDASQSESTHRKVDIVGEINLSITVFEQVILAEPEYSKMMNMLNDDDDIELPLNVANIAIGELDRLAELLIRIYESSDRLVLRLSQLAAIEINGDVSTASILFRANTLLTKMLESFMRMVGGSFLESSIGSVIRPICTGKVELEIDPSKLKSSISSSQREKILNENSKELNRLANAIWQSMYVNRSKCPNRLRKVFVKIQEYVGNAYDDQDMRLTSISAFIFLRFFVPAILNPRLFNLIQFQPDSKSQRTLTLLAKTLQGLGNLTLFGIKEPWMSVMNEFITTQLDSFRDYISFISRESDSTKPEWTSRQFEGYGLPYALKASLPAASRDGIPSLPHLLDPVRDCSLLANLLAVTQRKSSSSENVGENQSSSVLPSNRPRRKTAASESFSTLTIDGNKQTSIQAFLSICEELHARSERRCTKIIQSELKNSNNIKPTSIANTRDMTNIVANNINTTSISAPQGLPPLNSKKLSPESLPQNIINSRKIQDHRDKLSPPPTLSATVTLTSSISGSSISSTTRWKRSHTISAEHGSPSSNSPHSPSISHSMDAFALRHHQLAAGTDPPNFHAPFYASPFSPSSSGVNKHETSGFVLQNRSPRSQTISSPNSLSGTEKRAARRALLSPNGFASVTGQSVSRHGVQNNILSDESLQVPGNATNSLENKPIISDQDEPSQSSLANTWESNKLVFNYPDHDDDPHPAEITPHLNKIRSLSRKSGFQLGDPNHFTADFQSISQKHPPESQEENGISENDFVEKAGGCDILRIKKINVGKLNEKTSKTSFHNYGGAFNKGHRSSSSLSLSSLVSSSSLSSVTHSLKKNLKLHHFHHELDSKHTSIVNDRMNYTSPIDTTVGKALPSNTSSFISPSSYVSDTPFTRYSQQHPPSSSGSNTITIFQRDQPLSPISQKFPQGNTRILTNRINDDSLNHTPTASTSKSFRGLTVENSTHYDQPQLDANNAYPDHYNCRNNSSSVSSGTSSNSNNVGGIISSPTTSVTTNTTATTAFSIASVSSGISQNHPHRKGFMQKIMRKNSVARS